MFAMACSSYEINAGFDLTPVLNRRLLKNLAKEIDARLLFKDLRYIYIYITHYCLRGTVCDKTKW